MYGGPGAAWDGGPPGAEYYEAVQEPMFPRRQDLEWQRACPAYSQYVSAPSNYNYTPSYPDPQLQYAAGPAPGYGYDVNSYYSKSTPANEYSSGVTKPVGGDHPRYEEPTQGYSRDRYVSSRKIRGSSRSPYHSRTEDRDRRRSRSYSRRSSTSYDRGKRRTPKRKGSRDIRRSRSRSSRSRSVSSDSSSSSASSDGGSRSRKYKKQQVAVRKSSYDRSRSVTPRNNSKSRNYNRSPDISEKVSSRRDIVSKTTSKQRQRSYTPDSRRISRTPPRKSRKSPSIDSVHHTPVHKRVRDTPPKVHKERSDSKRSDPKGPDTPPRKSNRKNRSDSRSPAPTIEKDSHSTSRKRDSRERSISIPKTYKIRSKSRSPSVRSEGDSSESSSAQSNSGESSVSTPSLPPGHSKSPEERSSKKSASRDRTPPHPLSGRRSTSRDLSSRRLSRSPPPPRRRSRSYSPERKSRRTPSSESRDIKRSPRLFRNRKYRRRSRSPSRQRRRWPPGFRNYNKVKEITPPPRLKTDRRSRSRSKTPGTEDKSHSKSVDKDCECEPKLGSTSQDNSKLNPSDRYKKTAPGPSALLRDDIEYEEINFDNVPPPKSKYAKNIVSTAKLKADLERHLQTQNKLHVMQNMQSAPQFKNDGSFMEMFKRLQDGKDGDAKSDAAPSESTPEIVEKKKPAFPFIGKRRGGRVLKTGIVKKAKAIDEQLVDNTPKDAWALYMQEVKKYKQTSCDEDRKTRPLVK